MKELNMTAILAISIPVPSHHCQVTVIHLKPAYPLISPTGTRSSNKMQWYDFKIGYHDDSLPYGHQEFMPRGFLLLST